VVLAPFRLAGTLQDIRATEGFRCRREAGSVWFGLVWFGSGGEPVPSTGLMDWTCRFWRAHSGDQLGLAIELLSRECSW
jgi:hypothetical protein